MTFSKYAVALSALFTTGSALAQSGGTLTYGPAAAVAAPTASAVATPVPIPSLFLLPLGIAIAFLGYRAIKKNGAGSVLGVLLLALGVTAGVTSSLNIQKAIAAAMVELNQPAGGTVNIPAGDAIYTNTSGVALEIGTVVAPPSCATSAPADECISGLVLEDTQSCSTVYDCDQTISFTSTAPADATVGGATYAVTATSTSGLAVSFSTASSACSIAGSTVSFIAAGDCVIDADQAGDTDYNAAPQVQLTLSVDKKPQTISFTSTAPADATVGGATYAVTATSTSGLAVSFSTASSACSIAGSTVSFIAAGDCVIDADQAGDADYNAAPQVQLTLSVDKKPQTISFTSTAPADATVGGATYAVTATSTSGLAVSFSTASSACSIAGSTVSFIAAGDCVIDADQAGDADYNPAPQTSQAITASLPVVTVTKKADGVEAETPTPGAFTISRTGGTTNLLTVNFVLTGTANGVTGTPSTPAVLTDDEDYTVSSLTQVEIPAGSSSVDVTITVLDDEVYDPTEDVILTLQADPAAYTLSASDATLEIAAMDKRIFVTAATFDGNLDGIGGADLKCNADTNKPGVGTYKAMIAGVRFRSAFPPVDWVLTAGTSYFRRPDEVFVARANVDRVLGYYLSAVIGVFGLGTGGEVWTGATWTWGTLGGGIATLVMGRGQITAVGVRGSLVTLRVAEIFTFKVFTIRSVVMISTGCIASNSNRRIIWIKQVSAKPQRHRSGTIPLQMSPTLLR